jgi:hypothetical protein
VDTAERITKLAAALDQRTRLEQAVIARLKDFCSMLYTRLEVILQQIEHQSSGVNTESRRMALEAGFSSFSFLWQGAYIEFLPVPTVAVTADQPISPLIPQVTAGRIMVYRGNKENPYESYPSAEIFVFEDGSWAAAGFAGLRAESAYSPDSLGEFVLIFLEHLTYELITYHRPRKEMKYNPDMHEPEGHIGFRRNNDQPEASPHTA